jgi:hypothetical protein
MKMLAFGDSHINALIAGYERTLCEQAMPYSLEFVRLNSTSRPDELIERFETDKTLDALICCAGGNAYFVQGALCNPRPFDFVLPESPYLPLSVGAELIPYDLVRERFISDLQPSTTFVEALMANTDLPLIFISPPPPVGDPETIAKYIPKDWAYDLAARGVAPSALRYKLWCLHVGVMKELNRKMATAFIEAPSMSKDNEGFLRKEYQWDAIHATPSYGQLIVQLLINLVMRPFAT